MRNRPYKVRHLKEARWDLEQRAHTLNTLWNPPKKSHREKKGFFARMAKWFS